MFVIASFAVLRWHIVSRRIVFNYNQHTLFDTSKYITLCHLLLLLQDSVKEEHRPSDGLRALEGDVAPLHRSPAPHVNRGPGGRVRLLEAEGVGGRHWPRTGAGWHGGGADTGRHAAPKLVLGRLWASFDKELTEKEEEQEELSANGKI